MVVRSIAACIFAACSGVGCGTPAALDWPSEGRRLSQQLTVMTEDNTTEMYLEAKDLLGQIAEAITIMDTTRVNAAKDVNRTVDDLWKALSDPKHDLSTYSEEGAEKGEKAEIALEELKQMIDEKGLVEKQIAKEVIKKTEQAKDILENGLSREMRSGIEHLSVNAELEEVDIVYILRQLHKIRMDTKLGPLAREAAPKVAALPAVEKVPNVTADSTDVVLAPAAKVKKLSTVKAIALASQKAYEEQNKPKVPPKRERKRARKANKTAEDRSRLLGPLYCQEKLQIALISSSMQDEVQRLCRLAKNASMVAFSAESRHDSPAAAVLQLAFLSGHVYVIQLKHLDHLPAEVRSMLSENKCRKVGFAIETTIGKLRHADINVSSESAHEFEPLKAEGVERTLGEAALHYLNFTMLRDEAVKSSNWERRMFLPSQLRHAAMNAWVTLNLHYVNSTQAIENEELLRQEQSSAIVDLSTAAPPQVTPSRDLWWATRASNAQCLFAHTRSKLSLSTAAFASLFAILCYHRREVVASKGDEPLLVT
eukprot:gnl/TRDRNA2_/TRDRNA2_87126_c0_seq2.p1 gnl/TRDRNA2_/TRDRNA2_87126_c0~~gnl/TRDRNA2_/TRDRNA2_87126_c0_seq2.p1  ORF type:complete len:539 (+),score=86.24 gnl/TRDRNA2_/TRDRNA2_87126_c0_seq2:220-1836(+)